MKCPKCKDPMVTLELNEVEIDYCYSCQGIWLDQGELELLLENDQNSDKLIASIEADKNSREKKLKCPICRKKMKKISAGIDGTVRLDKCSQDHGYWFDKGELELILKMGSKSENSRVVNLLQDMFNK